MVGQPRSAVNRRGRRAGREIGAQRCRPSPGPGRVGPILNPGGSRSTMERGRAGGIRPPAGPPRSSGRRPAAGTRPRACPPTVLRRAERNGARPTMDNRRDEKQDAPGSSRPTASATVRHAVREQEVLWDEFLAMARSVVDSLALGVEALCDGRLEVIAEVKDAEEHSDREEVRIEQECLRVLALYEPVASDLRRLATMLKVSRDWERIADLAARIARRARKLARKSQGVAVPEALKALARDVLDRVRASYDALAARDTRARGPHRRRSLDRRPVPPAPQGPEGSAPPGRRPAQRLAPVARHRAEPRADRRPRDRHRPDDRLPRGGDHHPAQDRVALFPDVNPLAPGVRGRIRWKIPD